MGRLPDKVIAETAELESERRWEELFARSQDFLARMAGEARQEYRAGLTEPLDLEAVKSRI